MNGRWFATAAAVGVLGLMCGACGQGASSARAAAQAKASLVSGTAAAVMGCVKVSADNACKTMKGPGGAIYDVTNAGIDTARGKGVSLSGRDNGQTTPCGTVLTDVKFDYLGISCAAPVAQAPAESARAG